MYMCYGTFFHHSVFVVMNSILILLFSFVFFVFQLLLAFSPIVVQDFDNVQSVNNNNTMIPLIITMNKHTYTLYIYICQLSQSATL